MFCPSCGTQIPDAARYCYVCGKSPAAAITATPATPKAASQTTKEAPKRRPESNAVMNVLIGFIILLVLYIGVKTLSLSSQSSAGESLFSGPVVVKAGGIYFVRFSVAETGRVIGRFEARGGTGNDIQAIIASSDDFENWQNGHAAGLLYQTGKTTVSGIDVPISRAGIYYLAFNNKFSLLSDKTVTGNIALYH